MPLVWLLVAIVFAFLEVGTVAFFAAFIAIAALPAALLAWLGTPLLVQVAVFAVVALAGLVGVRPFAMRRLERHHAPRLQSGAQAMIGQRALVVDPIRDPVHPGHVLIAGERWPAVTGSGLTVDEGQTVIVLEIRQATLVVAPE